MRSNSAGIAAVPKTEHRAFGRWSGGLILLLVFAVFANSFPGHYFLDDYVVIETNPLVSHPNLFEIFTTDYWGPDVNSGLYRPFVILSFAIKYLLFGLEPWADHLLNVVLHAVNSLMVMIVLRRWGWEGRVAWLTAALFAVHPIHTEVVNEAVGRAELLAALGVLLVLHVAGTVEGRRRYPLLAASFFLGVMSKESAVTVMALVPLVDYFRFRSLNGWWKDKWRNYATLVLAAAAWLAIRVWVVQRWAPPDAHDPVYTPLQFMAPLQRILTALEIQWLYLWKLIVPLDLRAIYSGPGFLVPVETLWSPFGATLLLGSALMVGAAFWFYLRGSVLGLVVVLYVVSFSPTANLIFPIGVTMAERLAYLPSLWFCLGLALFLEILRGKLQLRFFVAIFAICLLIWFSYLTLRRNLDFHDDITLWEADTALDPQNAMAWMYLGNQYWIHGEIAKSDVAFKKALAAVPDFPEAMAAYAAFLLERGQLEEALQYALQAESFPSADTPTLHMVTANIYLDLGNPEDAGVWLEKARWLYAQDDYFLFLEGRVSEAKGQLKAAIESYQRIGTALPQWKIWTRLPSLLMTIGDFAEAERVLRHVLKSEESPEYWNSLGVALALQGKLMEADGAFSKAIELSPQNRGYRQNRERLLSGEFRDKP